MVNEFEEMLELLISAKKPIILFGTKSAAELTKKTLDMLDIDISCFCDNDVHLQDSIFMSKPVYSPEKAKLIYDDPIIIICSGIKDIVKTINKSLQAIGFNTFVSYDSILYAYNTRILKRKIKFYDFKDIKLDSVILAITEKCNLRCTDCMSLVPYVEKPKHYDTEVLINSINMLSSMCYSIKNLIIFGGEPLLHKDLTKICQVASEMNNIMTIYIITNGTICPTEDQASELSKYLTFFEVSDYRQLSTKKLKIKEICEKNNIPLKITDIGDKWYRCGSPTNRGRVDSENNEVFKQCDFRYCHLIANGEYHLCGISAFGTAINAIPSNYSDYVNIIENHSSLEDKQAKLKELINRKNFITACNYCDGISGGFITAAVQTDAILKY